MGEELIEKVTAGEEPGPKPGRYPEYLPAVIDVEIVGTVVEDVTELPVPFSAEPVVAAVLYRVETTESSNDQ